MTPDLIEELLAGKHRALARVISKIEDRSPGYRDLVAELHRHAGDAHVIGVTGSPGAGKSTLVDKLAAGYHEDGLTVGVIAIDPASPFTGGAVLGDRIRMASNVGDMDVFFRSMSARGRLGGLSTATADAVTALEAFGKDRIIVETVGAGQNEVDIVRTAETVVVLVPPGSGDDIQMLKAGILEIADLFVVNKADLDGANRTVQELQEMLQYRDGDVSGAVGHHGAAELPDHLEEDEEQEGELDGHHSEEASGHPGDSSASRAATTAGSGPDDENSDERATWAVPILETVANKAEGVAAVRKAVADHREFLVTSGSLVEHERMRYAQEIRTLLREDCNELVGEEIERQGGIDGFLEAVQARESDPYSVADEILAPVRDCLNQKRS